MLDGKKRVKSVSSKARECILVGNGVLGEGGVRRRWEGICVVWG